MHQNAVVRCSKLGICSLLQKKITRLKISRNKLWSIRCSEGPLDFGAADILITISTKEIWGKEQFFPSIFTKIFLLKRSTSKFHEVSCDRYTYAISHAPITPRKMQNIIFFNHSVSHATLPIVQRDVYSEYT